MKRRITCLVALAAALALPGCARYYYGAHSEGAPLHAPRSEDLRTDLLQANYRAVDVLLSGASLDPQRSVLVATLVNVDRLGESSRLGRIFSEQIAGRLVQRGVAVTELKLRERVALQPRQGELLLSREVREVSQQHDAQAVVVGTYAVSPHTLYVSLKLVSPVGNTVVAASDYALPMDENVRGLLLDR